MGCRKESKTSKKPCKLRVHCSWMGVTLPISLSSISMHIHYALQIKGRQSESGHLTPLPSQVPWHLFLNSLSVLALQSLPIHGHFYCQAQWCSSLTPFLLVFRWCVKSFFSLLSRSQDLLWGNGSKWRGRELTRSVLDQDSRLVLTCGVHSMYW